MAPVPEAEVASLRQDLWFGWDPRRRGLRIGPFAGAAARLLVKPPPGVSLDGPEWKGFIERLAVRCEVIAYESPNAEFEALVQDLGRALALIHAQYRDGLPLVTLGFGVSATAALVYADNPFVAGLVALVAAPPQGVALDELTLATHLQPAAHPLLVLDAREADERLRALLLSTVARRGDSARIEVAGDGAKLLRPPWPELITAWADGAARSDAGSGKRA